MSTTTSSATETDSGIPVPVPPSLRTPPAPADSVRVLTGTAGGRDFAVLADQVAEVVPFRPPTRLPGAPPHVAGIVNLRGTVVTVLNLARRLGLPEGDPSTSVIVLISGGARPVGVIVDSVHEVALLPADSIERPHGGERLSDMSIGILRKGNTVALLLDLGHLARESLAL